MEFLELVKMRRSVRSYLNKSVEREKITRCVEAARLAPSACNSQPWKFIVVDESDLKNEIARAATGNLITFNHFSFEAPVIVVVVVEKANITATVGRTLKDIPYNYIDCGIAIEHFCLQATEEGLGSCILGWFDEKKVKKVLRIPSDRKIAALITLGYPKENGFYEKNRKTIEKILSFNKW